MLKLSDVTIRTRLIVAMAMSLMLVAAVGGLSLAAMSTVDRATNELHSRWMPTVRLLSEVNYGISSHRLRFVRAIFTDDAAERELIFKAAEEREDDAEALLETLERRLESSPDELANIRDIRRLWRRYLDQEEAIRASLGALSPAELSFLINDKSRWAFNLVKDQVNADIEFNNRGADRSGAEAVATFDRAMRLNLSLFGCALVLMAAFVVVVVRSISRPIEQITEVMRRLAGGDRTAVATGPKGSNELGRMAAAVAVFRDYLVERDAARDALERTNERLEEQVEARNARLKQANASLQQEITERIQAAQQLKSMQEELIRTENLAVIGQLSAGIAHELNQPLAALGTLSENAVRFLDLGDHPTTRFNLDRIVHLVARMGILTERLRSFARRSAGDAEEVEIGRSVDNALAILGHRLSREATRVEVAPPPEPIVAEANAVRVEQILVNLIGNAIDATAGVDAPQVTVSWQSRADTVVVRVADNGVGLGPEMESKIFEPFFTTKKNGGGLGLGLAISADIAKGFGGSLSAANRDGGGAVFTLELPEHGNGGQARG
jgi:phosphoglycerate-specific signal transduction histidine kinase